MEPNLTYRELKKMLDQMNDEQLDMNVTVYDVSEDEYYPVNGIGVASKDNGVLDFTHPYLNIKGEEE